MKLSQNFFKKSKTLTVDKFLQNVLYDKKIGYYFTNIPFGYKGDFLTAPGISSLFSEIIAIWLISSWNTLGKPKKLNIVELGPGDGALTKVMINVFKKFPNFNNSVEVFLYEKSNLLKKLQKKNIKKNKVKWIKSFSEIKNGPVIFFGNEFFDAIPIKQFLRRKKNLYEKNFKLWKKGKIKEIYKKANFKDIKLINKYKSLKNLNFIEFPKQGFKELENIIKKINKLGGGILLIDYGYFVSNNSNTLQSVKKHKINDMFENLGKADITSLVNFNLLKEFFEMKKLKTKKIVTQKFFLEKMGIIDRANILSNKMSFSEQTNLYSRLKRLLDEKMMGKLFKVIFAYKFDKNNFLGFK